MAHCLRHGISRAALTIRLSIVHDSRSISFLASERILTLFRISYLVFITMRSQQLIMDFATDSAIVAMPVIGQNQSLAGNVRLDVITSWAIRMEVVI